MRRWLTPLIVLFLAALIQVETDLSDPSVKLKSATDPTVRIISPDDRPVIGVMTVAPPSRQSKTFLDACRDMFALDHENAIRIHTHYLGQSQAAIEQLGDSRAILELMTAKEALAEFKTVHSPTVRDRTILCLAMEPIITDATSSQEP